MPPKKVDPRIAKEKKQKKIAIGGAVLLIGLVGFQAPGMMKRLKGPQPVEAAPVATSTTPGSPGEPTSGSAPLEPPTLSGPNATPAAGGDAESGEASGELVSFSIFASKDPFKVQVGEGTAPTGETPADAGAPQPDDGAPDAGSPETGSGSAPGAQPAAATSAKIAVNGVEETVAVNASFPAAGPVFTLVALTAKSAKIGVAEGGTFSAGSSALTVKLKQPVTLVDTASGTQYVVELRAVG